MGLSNGVHHLAIATADIKTQIEFFNDVLGMELVALYWMHGVQGAWHGFLKLNDSSYIAFVQRAGVLCTGNEKASADELVVAVGVFELFANLAAAVPVLRRLEHQDVVALLEAPAKPLAEQRILRPVTLAQARPVRLPCVFERRMLRVDAAIDKADDDALAIEAERTAEPDVGVKEAQEVRL